MAAVAGVGTASAADSVVGVGNCILANGGQVTRPAGSTIVIRNGWTTKNYGIGVEFLGAQTTTLSVNGGPTVDVSNKYLPPTKQSDGHYTAYVFYPTGVMLANPGDTMTFAITVSASHLLADVTNGFEGFDPGKPLFGGPGVVFGGTCTVTAV
jgi:hypothetical protein